MSWGFAHPWALLLIPLVPAFAIYSRRWPRPSLTFPRTATFTTLGADARFIGRVPDLLRGGAILSLIIALAGPRTGISAVDLESDGIAIMLVVDLSSSMLAEDFHPHNRLAVAKERVADFIRGRRYDRIGLVAFAGEALTQVPLTVDYRVLYNAVEELDVGMIEDGTAIGTAIATAANRLRHAPGESKVMILMTDGENNRGQIDPLTAARAAAAFDIKIYAIGVGTEGVAPIPVARGLLGGYQYAMLPVHIDEELLRDVTEMTGGQYFRATNAAALDSIYDHIDRLETTSVEVRRYIEHTPRHLTFLILAALCLTGEWILRASRWGRVP